MSLANYDLGTNLLAEVDEAKAVITRTKSIAGRLAPSLAGQLRRWVHDADTLAVFKAELAQFDSRKKTWRPRK